MDLLRLYLLVVSEKVDYQLKFMDIATNSNSVGYFVDKASFVDPVKFIKWWFMDYEKIIEEMLNPPEKVDKKISISN